MGLSLFLSTLKEEMTMARRRKRRRVSRKRKRAVSPRVKAARKRFARAVDKCIVIASRSRAGTRMKALGKCVKRTLK